MTTPSDEKLARTILLLMHDFGADVRPPKRQEIKALGARGLAMFDRHGVPHLTPKGRDFFYRHALQALF